MCTGFVLTQRTGPVYIDLDEKRDDLSIVLVPEARLNNLATSPSLFCILLQQRREGVVVRALA